MSINLLLNPQGGLSFIGQSDRKQGRQLLFVDSIQHALTPEKGI